MKIVPIGSMMEKVETWDPVASGSVHEFTYIDLGALDQETKAITRPQRIRPAEAPSRARQLVRQGDVLVATVRPNLNGVAVVPPEFDGATASTGFAILRPTQDLHPKYLFHWVRSPRFVSEMIRRATGQSYPAVSDRIVRESMIPAPPIEVQRRIVQVLDHVDALRAKRREAIRLLDDLIQSIFLDMFGDPRVNPHGFVVRALSEIVDAEDRINYGVVQPGDNYESGIPLVRVSDLVDGGVDRSRIKRIDPAIESRYRRSRIKGNEILVGCVGSIGQISLVGTNDIGSNIARAVARIPISSAPFRVYLAEHLRTKSVQNYFERELRTVAQPTLNIKQLAQTKVMVPASGLQTDFMVRVDAIRLQRRHQSAYRSSLDELFASLQHRAFIGELWDDALPPYLPFRTLTSRPFK